MNLLKKLFGTKTDRDVRRAQPIVDEVNALGAAMAALSDEALAAKTAEFRARLAEGETEDDILAEAFAVMRDACRRHVGRSWPVCGLPVEWNMVPFDVQVMGAVSLHEGKIAEMATGEGKTLVATMPLYLNALSGRGVHLITVNDYLARRDSEWMGPLFRFLGLTVGCIQNDMDFTARRLAYGCDITYGTNNEFGFDYLRDNMATRKDDRVQRGHNYAIVDEVDSVLIDEARTPLIISGPVRHSTHRYDEMRAPVDNLVRLQTRLVNGLVAEAEERLASGVEERQYEAGIKILQAMRGAPKNKRLMKLLQDPANKRLAHRVETDFMRDKRMGELDEDLYYAIDEKNHSIDLSDKGREALSPGDKNLFVIPNLAEDLHPIEADESLSPQEKALRKERVTAAFMEKNEKVHNISQLLRAYSLYEKDVEYVVQEGKVMIVDEFTGRLLPGRRYSDGLHQAIEAKEQVAIERETQTLATITLQNYFRLYDKLAGMTGTAETEAGEFWEIYRLDVVVVPTHRPVCRADEQDAIYRTRKEKFDAILEEIADAHERGQPVLVGTISVEVSEMLSRLLKRRGIPHSVLNAKYHQQEAEIVARAGERGAVTIATNMAGRGTDIRLGPGVPDLGGLHIVGTERHEARRIDRQLRGRAGRQGDPGSSRFFLSLEDDLMRLFGSERISGIMQRIGLQEGEVIEHPMVTRAIERAQRKVEQHNFDIRKHLLEYDNVMNKQREVIYERRAVALEAPELRDELEDLLRRVVSLKVAAHTDEKTLPENWSLDDLRRELEEMTVAPLALPPLDEIPGRVPDVEEEMARTVLDVFRQRTEARVADMGPEVAREFERWAILANIDENWKDHLYELDGLRSGIGLRGYGGKDPVLEYKIEAFKLFEELMDKIDEGIAKTVLKPFILRREGEEVAERRREVVRARARAPLVMSSAKTGGEAAPRPAARRVEERVGRNDPCPCGSGKKFKKCHGVE
jgi:preprotein translocase subunit SecA